MIEQIFDRILDLLFGAAIKNIQLDKADARLDKSGLLDIRDDNLIANERKCDRLF